MADVRILHEPKFPNGTWDVQIRNIRVSYRYENKKGFAEVKGARRNIGPPAFPSASLDITPEEAAEAIGQLQKSLSKISKKPGAH